MSRRRRYLVLAICCFALFLVGTDSTIVNVALPAMRGATLTELADAAQPRPVRAA
jgi:hypothetical protein